MSRVPVLLQFVDLFPLKVSRLRLYGDAYISQPVLERAFSQLIRKGLSGVVATGDLFMILQFGKKSRALVVLLRMSKVLLLYAGCSKKNLNC